MMKLLSAALVAATIVAAPSTAVTYDAFTSFTGTQGAGGFYYGSSTNLATNFTLYGASTNCFIAGSTCLQQAANNDVPGVTKSTTTSVQYGSVNVPDDRLLVHPASTSDYLVGLFLVPTDGQYKITATFNVQDINPSGVNVGTLFSPQNTFPIQFTPLTTLTSGNPTVTFTTTLFLNTTDLVGFAVDNDGSYNNDSTGVNFTISNVPEPATWALMITGFGMIGFAARRRAAAASA